ncbi:hypothetical protein CDO73_00160 [Saccharibacillus sp. O23]|uniref:hypothetical protein n=1 Tax=Saccharibacillus sp. O23 TaxID=2009338 RepID=UPI000B4E08ED|nr:hypothetical protein [Saccharibacillus sp. O23]OWR32965.1 hypothetical protein CDO73_00160 [Saccharibacillus sp. O23]
MSESPLSSARSSRLGDWLSACAHCERIRLADGWRRPEPGECEDATLTHDICPDCIRQLYPKYARIANRLQKSEEARRFVQQQKTQAP